MSTAPGAWLSIRYRDAESALGYLVAVVGFTESVVHRGAERPIEHAELLWPSGGGLMLGSYQEADNWSGSAGTPGSATAYLQTDDPDAVYARVGAAGWEIIRPLQQAEGYENREFAFLDPEENAWSIGTYRGQGF